MSPVRTRSLAATLLVTALLLAACGDDGSGLPPSGTPSPTAEGPPGDGSPGPVDPCDLLTTQDVETASGLTVTGPPELTEVGQGAVRCSWFVDPDLAAVVTLFVYTENARALHDAGKQDPQGSPLPGVRPVAGIGEDAYFSTVATATTLTVLVADVSFFVQFVVDDEDLAVAQAEAAAIELARLVAGRL